MNHFKKYEGATAGASTISEIETKHREYIRDMRERIKNKITKQHQENFSLNECRENEKRRSTIYPQPLIDGIDKGTQTEESEKSRQKESLLNIKRQQIAKEFIEIITELDDEHLERLWLQVKSTVSLYKTIMEFRKS